MRQGWARSRYPESDLQFVSQQPLGLEDLDGVKEAVAIWPDEDPVLVVQDDEEEGADVETESEEEEQLPGVVDVSTRSSGMVLLARKLNASETADRLRDEIDRLAREATARERQLLPLSSCPAREV